MENLYKNLLEQAKEASKLSYSPYSNFAVGACVLYESGKTYCACNVENVSYGLSICAERSAISKAISENEKTKIKAVAIYSPNQKNCMPCGACRQWLCEFAQNGEIKIILENDDEKINVVSLDEIFPNSFKMTNNY
ncbi:MAG: cytidine deaminase [Candidatus Gastranaerophilales bacterium]|nr:cytidine deaminase [Candidatus Gastranaerophilales bacterium]